MWASLIVEIILAADGSLSGSYSNSFSSLVSSMAKALKLLLDLFNAVGLYWGEMVFFAKRSKRKEKCKTSDGGEETLASSPGLGVVIVKLF